MLQSLDGAAVRRWAATCCDALAEHRDEIDALNVFPVADQDTGHEVVLIVATHWLGPASWWSECSRWVGSW